MQVQHKIWKNQGDFELCWKSGTVPSDEDDSNDCEDENDGGFMVKTDTDYDGGQCVQD